MSYQVTTDFRQGLDARKFFLALPPGALLKCNNAHITQGGEIEKRKAFVPITLPAAYTGIHFGLQPAAGAIYLFGSKVLPHGTEGSRSRAANVASLFIICNGTRAFVAGDVVNISGVGGVGYNGNNITLLSATAAAGGTSSQTITYASVGANEGVVVEATGAIVLVQSILPAPLVYEVLPNPGIQSVGLAPNMTAINSSTLFGNTPFAIAAYDDGSTYPFYGLPQAVTMFQGEVVPGAVPPIFDSYIGMNLALYTAIDNFSGQNLLKQLGTYINAQLTSYTDNWAPGDHNFDIFSIPTTLDGTPYTVAVLVTSAAGTLTATQQNTGTAAVAAAQALGTFQIISAGPGTQATGTLTNTSDGQLNDGDTVTIDAITYRFKNTMAQAYDVKIQGAGRAATLASFAAAINGSGVVLTDYYTGTVKHPTVLCSALNNTTTTGPTSHFTLALMAIVGGTAGNALVLSSTASTRLVASGATLSGAVASQITQIVINGATNLLSGAVAFTTDEPTTAAAVVNGINSNVGTGFQATSNGSVVSILPVAAGTGDNGFSIQVQAHGTVVCGSGSFSLSGTGFSVDYCRANAVDLMNDNPPFVVQNIDSTLTTNLAMVYPQVPVQVLSDFCRAVANSINSGTGTHGYLANCPQGGISIFLCKAVTTSTDKQQTLDVSVTATATNTGSVVPGSLTPLSVTLSGDAAVIPVQNKSTSITAQVSGGLAPYTYRWTQVGTPLVFVVANNAKAAQTTFSYTHFTSPTRGGGPGTSGTPLNNQAQFICVVTDALGEQADSEVCSVTVLATPV